MSAFAFNRLLAGVKEMVAHRAAETRRARAMRAGAGACIDSDGRPLDAEVLARIFRPIDPETFNDAVCGEALRQIALEDPDIIAAVADVDRTIIWANLDLTPEERSLNLERRLAAHAQWRAED